MDATTLAQSNDMQPVHGTVDLDIPIDVLWQCFRQANLWPRWNSCMYFVLNRDLKLGKQLRWVFEPIRWYYPYKLTGLAKIVEVEPPNKVTWEVTALPGFYARHSYTLEDLGDGRTRFGSWEQAQGPTLRRTLPFWRAHFEFVKDRSLQGGSYLESVYRHANRIDKETLPAKPYIFPNYLRRPLRTGRMLTVNYRALLPGVHVALGGGGNSLILNDGDETLLVDSKLPPFDRQLHKWISANVAAPVSTIVNTHFHYDHTQGNLLYPHATIIAHEEAPRLMRQRDSSIWRKHSHRLPTELVSDQMTITIGEQPVTIHHTVDGHTISDLWLHINRLDRDIIVTGDIASLGIHPFFDQGDGGANLDNTIRQLHQWADDFPKAIFVPGHGNVANSNDLRQHADYLAYLREHVGRAIAAGLSPRQALHKIDTSRFRLAPIPIFHYKTLLLSHSSNIRQVYKQLRS